MACPPRRCRSAASAIDTDVRWYCLVATVLLIAMILSRNLDLLGGGPRAAHGAGFRDCSRCGGRRHLQPQGAGFRDFSGVRRAPGALTAHYAGFITPDMSSILKNVELATMVVVGGRGSTLGAILGAALLTALPQLLGGFFRLRDGRLRADPDDHDDFPARRDRSFARGKMATPDAETGPF